MVFSSSSMIGRPSSPLNPHQPSSSSPLTSPTTTYTPLRTPLLQPYTLSTPSSSKTHRTRYARPVEAKRAATCRTGPNDLFSEGTTPMEGAMWRGRFTRRMEEREQGKRVREIDLARRRSGSGAREEVNEEEADRRARADDEEVSE